jgi:hypothetical protein
MLHAAESVTGPESVEVGLTAVATLQEQSQNQVM